MIEFRTGQVQASESVTTLAAYDRIYRTLPLVHQDSFYRWALEQAQARPGQRILDVSCGVGRLVDLGARVGLRAVGIDFAEEAVRRGHDAGTIGSLLVANALSLPFTDGCFDRVVNLGSLEHYEDPARGVAEMARVLANDGQAIVLLPNSFGLLHVLYVWRHGKIFDDGQPLQRYGTQSDWARLLEDHGLRVIRVVKLQRALPRTWSDLCWHLRHPRKLAQAAAGWFLPVNVSGFFVFICGRKNG